MKTAILLPTFFCALWSFGQAKSCSKPIFNALYEEASVTKVPEIENYNGQFQFEINKGDQISITHALLNHISELQQNDQETILDMGNGRILHIAPASIVDASGKGPFSAPFIEK